MTMPLIASVESRMRESILASQQRENPVCHAALHHLEAGGSRVRASLCLRASTQLGLDASDATTLASVCELLHNASLIHDDLLDRAPLRRGRSSVWAAYSDATAVCAGDLLLTNAFALVGELRRVEHVVPVLTLVHRRTQDAIFGQGREQAMLPDTLRGYEAVAIGKSASLLLLPLELPMLVSGNDQFIPTARRVAEAFATAYQIVDDLDDYCEDVRNGSLNVVSVVQAQGGQDYASACALICGRAEELIQIAIQGTAELPNNCGCRLVELAGKMSSILRARRESLMRPVEHSNHGG